VNVREEVRNVARLRIDAEGPALIDVLASRRAEIEECVLRDGAVLLTGAGAVGPAGLAVVRRALALGPASDREPFAARDDYGDGVLSWPKWSPDREMCMHHERSYAQDAPGVLLMGRIGAVADSCRVLLADTREVLRCLPTDLVARARSEGWLLIRNFLPNLGLPWSQVLSADSREEAHAVCSERAIDCAFLPNGALRLQQRRPVVAAHPCNGQECWFNDMAFLNQWSIPADERQLLLDAFGPDGVPFNTLLGSGAALDERDFWSIIEAYDTVHVGVDLEPGDVLVVDNMLMAHGRAARLGPWDVATALADRVPDEPAGGRPAEAGDRGVR